MRLLRRLTSSSIVPWRWRRNGISFFSSSNDTLLGKKRQHCRFETDTMARHSVRWARKVPFIRKKENGVVQRVPVIFLSVSPRPNRFLCLFSARTWPHRRAPVPLHPLFVGLQHDGQSWAATAAVRCFSHSCFNYYFVGHARPFNKSFQPPPFVRFDLEPADWHII